MAPTHRLLISISLLILVLVSSMFAQLDPKLFSGMKTRSIGPAGMSGRIASIDAVVSNPNIIYVGVSIGGVWKSTNGGTTWKSMFDDQAVSAVGAVAIYQANPSIIWVGTGEGNPRNSASVGNGIYRSNDGGDSWIHLGLEKTERIHRVVLDPTNPNVAYAAAMGQMWGENPDRGVYKTTDGGKSWRKVLYVNEKTGCADLVMDPKNPNKMFAAMWEYRRWPWFFKSGGPGSGLYVTHDGGESWKQITDKDGIPKGELGRIGLAIGHNNPDVVYALVEAKKNELIRSEDGGKTWRTVNNSNNVAPRPFYYADIYIDPQNENRIYSLHSNLTVSNDGGRTFTTLGGQNRVHSDHHALWIHPSDGSFIIDGSDGGVYISRDYGKSWQFVDNLPLAQFYHINIDNEFPYNVYGGMQDNGSWKGPSSVWENGGIRNWHWREVNFGDGFATIVDLSDSKYGYAMSQGGNLVRFNFTTGERKDIRPVHPDKEVKLRYNWNAGIAHDPFDVKTIYYGSQFVHKSTDRGENWTIISPDLTTDDKEKQKQQESGGLSLDVTAAENHCTILTIAPSSVVRDVLWVGTDDGNVQITMDGGKTWTNASSRIPDIPKNSWVAHIEPSKFDTGTAYVVFDDHRRSNWNTYVYKTADFGKTWTSLTKNNPMAGSGKPWGYALVIEQDPVKKDLLYLGTEFGLFISFDDGKNWMQWSHGFPTVSAMALTVHPREHDLVVGTHGRGAYILDDLRPLREASKTVFEKPMHMFEIPPAYSYQVRQMDGYHFPGDAFFRGDNKTYGASITYSLNTEKLPDLRPETREDEMGMGGMMGGMMSGMMGGAASGVISQLLSSFPQIAGMMGGSGMGEFGQRARRDSVTVRIEILDENGKMVRRVNGPAHKGINRATWNLRMDGPRYPSLGMGGMAERGEGFTPQGPEVLPGKYFAKIKVGKDSVMQQFEVLADPRTDIPFDVRKEKLEMILSVGKQIEVVAEMMDRIQKTRRAIDVAFEALRERRDSTANEAKRMIPGLRKALGEVSDKIMEEPNRVQGMTRNPETAVMKLGSVARSIGSSWDSVNDNQRTNFKHTEAFVKDVLEEYNKVFTERVKVFKSRVEAAGMNFFPDLSPLDLSWERKR